VEGVCAERGEAIVRTDASYSAQALRTHARSLADRKLAQHIETVCDEFARLSRIAKAGRGMRDALEELVDALKDDEGGVG